MSDAVSFKRNKRTVTYTDADGNTSSLTGDRPWRNNNPGNLRFTTDDAAIAAGALGRDGQGFAIFPSYSAGRTAMENWWNTKSTKGYAIEQALKVYAPASENDTEKYLKEIEAATGSSRTTRIDQLKSDQLKALYEKAQKFEGYDSGAQSGKSRVISPKQMDSSYIDDPSSLGNPLQHGLAELGLKSDDVHLTPMEADGGGKTSDTFHIRDNDTSEIIGSCVMTPNGCEIAAGDRKVVMSRLSDSDVSVEKYARNVEGEFEFLGMSRIGANDGITLKRPVIGIC